MVRMTVAMMVLMSMMVSVVYNGGDHNLCDDEGTKMMVMVMVASLPLRRALSDACSFPVRISRGTNPKYIACPSEISHIAGS